MSEGILESNDFDRYLSLSEKEQRSAAIASNDAFILAMARAVRKGCEKAIPGTFKDHTPSNARRIYADVSVSACGSPAAMCLESGSRSGPI
jgi:hypothetical protein